ncbi:uncharacterized protein N7458_008790 [Penicillium daleae]|uniref:Protein kinase domain-containing protein n=1 Tax=Penicillium daleae TaxID=63821 RepID=A0AAD6BW63_9EURO|nr:uncharacterized protein N7458_008790 [Penicillium daleae]KAJ5437792.1 hypothetical protein N7458_008790 [Penicillium daleae]
MSADSRIHDTASPTLFHPDLHKRNIFVSDNEPSIITGKVPDFATGATSPSSALRVDDSALCKKTDEVCTKFLVPRLALPRAMDEGMFRPVLYSYRTWKDGAVAFRHELIETSRDWGTLGFVGG